MRTYAHATPVAYIPEAGSTELSVPASISIRFTERIEVGASSIKVYGPQGNEVTTHRGEISQLDDRLFEVPLVGNDKGVYAVSWQVVSVDDGHFSKGSFSFLVDPEGAVYEGGGKVHLKFHIAQNCQMRQFCFWSCMGKVCWWHC